MEANDIPESKFVYPDKLYARCKDNKTLDISYAPQNMKAVEYTNTNAFIEKACEWLNKELYTRFSGKEHFVASNKEINLQEFIKKFENHMKGE